MNMGVEMQAGVILLVFWYIVLIATLVRIFLRENRTPASRIAWIFVVVTIPYLGVLAYVLLGEVNIGRKYNERLRKNVIKLYRQFYRKQAGDWEKSIKSLRNRRFQNCFSYANSITGFQPVDMNSARLMDGPDDTM